MKTVLIGFALIAAPASQQRDSGALYSEGRQFFESGQSEINAANQAQARGDHDGVCDNLRAAYLDYDKAKNRFYGVAMAVAGQPSAARDAQKLYEMAYDARERAKKVYESTCG